GPALPSALEPATSGVSQAPAVAVGGTGTAAGPATLVLLGFRLSRAAALAGLACWQLLSLSLVTLYALAARRPRDGSLVELADL
ncbi:MAG: hypothetical protein M3N21_08670, partial [Actinomycetota bacterium]|nr:hypothetical protein [Actinomycetota bacterium]